MGEYLRVFLHVGFFCSCRPSWPRDARFGHRRWVKRECCHDAGRWLALENVASILGWVLILLAIWLSGALLKSVENTQPVETKL